MTANRFDAVVIGGGVVGAAVARSLALAGQSVYLPERGWPGGEATAAAGGTLAPQVEFLAGDPLLELGVAARDLYAALAADLERAGVCRLCLRWPGAARIAYDEARAAALRQQAVEQRAAGLEAEWLDRADLARRHPGIGPGAVGAFLAPRDGAVDNTALGVGLLASGAKAGVVVAEREEALELLVTGGRVTGVRTTRGVREAGTVVLAAGAWTPSIRGLPRKLGVMPVRGQMALLAWPEGEPDAVLFGPHTVAVRRGADAVVGSTMESVGFEWATTEEGMDLIRRETGALLPALLGQPVKRMWAGLRPMTPDGKPVVGRDPEVEGLVYATGHGRNGILLGPLTGDIVRDLVVKGETSWDLTPYSVTRFGTT